MFHVKPAFQYICIVGDLPATKSPTSLEHKSCQKHVSNLSATCSKSSDVNKDWTHKNQDKDKDQSHKDKDKDKDKE